MFIPLRSDGFLQLIEGDRITSTPGIPQEANIDPTKLVNGVIVDNVGAATAYIVCKRGTPSGAMTFEKVLPAKFVIQHGYFDRYDQVRGIAPLSTAINTLQDTYEGFDYALAKAKVSQLFALAIYREKAEQMGILNSEATTNASGDDATRYDVDFGRGPIQLDLDPGDRAEFLESKNPSSEFQAFTQSMVMVALKALDIPYSFYDESHTNYSGSRQALLQYQLSADVKRNDNRELLNRITAWRLGLFIQDGELELPAGMRLSDLRWEWIPKNIRWIDPLKEVTADISAINARLKSPQQIAKEGGGDAFETIDEIAEYEAYAKEKGVSLVAVPPAAAPPEDDEDKANENNNRK